MAVCREGEEGEERQMERKEGRGRRAKSKGGRVKREGHKEGRGTSRVGKRDEKNCRKRNEERQAETQRAKEADIYTDLEPDLSIFIKKFSFPSSSRLTEAGYIYY